MWGRKRIQSADPEPVYAVAIVDLYARGRLYRAGISVIDIADPIYMNTQYAFSTEDLPLNHDGEPYRGE